jgi:putative lipoic acid-binding regulatory protein
MSQEEINNESIMEFPCEFPIKMMGHDTPKFHAVAISLIESHMGPVSDDAIKINTSTQGNFVSITVTITATSQKQLDDIYTDVSDHEDVLMAL